MKKFLLVALSAAMLFTCAPSQVAAATKCEHRNIQQNWHWKVITGYYHPYTVSNGVSAGCRVDVEEHCYDEECKDCHAIIRTVYTGERRDNHEIKSHNTW